MRRILIVGLLVGLLGSVTAADGQQANTWVKVTAKQTGPRSSPGVVWCGPLKRFVLFGGSVTHAFKGERPYDVQGFDPAVPTLEAFVSSMAALYAGTRDHARVLERYRELSAERLRRHFGLPHGLSRLALADRIHRDGRVSAEQLAPLTDAGAVDTAAELADAARRLDELVTEVIR